MTSLTGDRMEASVHRPEENGEKGVGSETASAVICGGLAHRGVDLDDAPLDVRRRTGRTGARAASPGRAPGERRGRKAGGASRRLLRRVT